MYQKTQKSPPPKKPASINDSTTTIDNITYPAKNIGHGKMNIAYKVTLKAGNSAYKVPIGNFQPTGELHPETAQNLLAKTIKPAGLTPVPTEKKAQYSYRNFIKTNTLSKQSRTLPALT